MKFVEKILFDETENYKSDPVKECVEKGSNGPCEYSRKVFEKTLWSGHPVKVDCSNRVNYMPTK